MKNRKIISKSFLFSLLLIFSTNSYSQTGLNFQGVARTTNNILLASQSISIKLTILRENNDGTKFEEYVETRKVNTNAQGLFTVVIGDTGTISKLGNFATINWRLSPKFLKIEMDPTGGNNFITMGTTQFQYVAYAQFAKSVDAENILGIIPVTLGGTGVNSLTGLKSALALDKLNNTADSSKPISVLMQASLDSKLNKSDTSKYTKQTYADSALLTKLSTTGNAATATKLATARNINGVSFDGSADITVNADAGTLTGTTLKSTVTGSSLTSVGTLANLTVTNPIIGSITGNAGTATSAISASSAGTSSTTTKLATARNINGVSFDGSADITITSIADAGTLTGTTLKSTITGSSLTSVGILNNATINGKLIVGTISSTSSSAILEANSTSQGFLPPRMTTAQRDAISSSSNGLVIFNTSSDGLEFKTSSGWVSFTASSSNAVFLPTIVIGSQKWMRENLDVVTYRNGDIIPQVTDPSLWSSLTTGAWCYYNNDANNGGIYGKLYNWYAVNDSRGLAPEGWHIPTDEEWETLTNKLGGELLAGGKMKAVGTKWDSPNGGATNESSFTGLPGGLRQQFDGTFQYIGTNGYWWSATDNLQPKILSLNKANSGASYPIAPKTMGISVRCIRN